MFSFFFCLVVCLGMDCLAKLFLRGYKLILKASSSLNINCSVDLMMDYA